MNTRAREWVTRVLAALTLALAIGASAPSVALSATPEEQFLGMLAKIAPFSPAKAKRLCRCAGNDSVGELRSTYGAQNGIQDYVLTCIVPQFTGGEVSSTFACPAGAFEILPK